jgi:hypothetical protein
MKKDRDGRFRSIGLSTSPFTVRGRTPVHMRPDLEIEVIGDSDCAREHSSESDREFPPFFAIFSCSSVSHPATIPFEIQFNPSPFPAGKA